MVPGLLIASLGYQSWLIYSYTFLHRVQVPRRKHRNQLNDGPIENIRSTKRDAELLLVGREVRHQQGPVIVAGDLNDVAWSHTTRLFSRISGLLDPRIGRGLFSTFHAHCFFLRWPLDHVFVSHHFALNGITRLPNCGSDHFPILVSLTYAPDPDRIDEVPQPEKDNVEEMHGKLEDVKSD